MVEHLRHCLILTVCCAGMTTLSFATAGPALCLSEIAGDLGMDHAQKGMFLSAAFWGLAFGILVAGVLADRLGFRAVLPAGAVLQAIGLFLISLAHTQWLALTGGAALGVGTGIGDALFTPIACAVHPGRRTRVTNLVHAFYPIGLVLSISLILLSRHLGWTWRGIFAALAILALPHGLAVLFLPLPSRTYQGPTRLASREILRRGPFLLIVGIMFLVGATEVGPSSWLPSFVEEATHASRTMGGVGLLLFAIAMIAGRFAAPAMVERFGTKRVFVAGSALCALCLLLAAAPVGTAFTVFCLSVLAFAIAGFWPTVLACAGDRFPQAGASMYSLLSASGCFGCAIGPVAIGLAAGPLGLAGGMAMLAAAPLIVIVLIMRLLK